MGDVTVIIPTLNEGGRIGSLVQIFTDAAIACIVCDGGSQDDTRALAREAGATVVDAPAGRASQMNAAAGALERRSAAGQSEPTPWLLFVHADVGLPPEPVASLLARSISQCERTGSQWARFDVQLIPDTNGSLGTVGQVVLRIIGAMMNWRSAKTGICTGDQGLLVRTDVFERVGGFDAIPLMEDIAISRRLKSQIGPPARLSGPLLVSGRRWERDGVWRTMASMWWFRLRYFWGVSAERLHREYYKGGAGKR